MTPPSELAHTAGLASYEGLQANSAVLQVAGVWLLANAQQSISEAKANATAHAARALAF